MLTGPDARRIRWHYLRFVGRENDVIRQAATAIGPAEIGGLFC